MFDAPLFKDAFTQLEQASEVMGLDPNILERLKYPKRALTVSVPIRLDDVFRFTVIENTSVTFLLSPFWS